jgi:hypothetical protein
MNLFELDELIKHPEVQKDAEMLAFYKKMRIDLVNKINAELAAKNLGVKLNQENA